MSKKERIQAVFEGRKPDKVPVFPFILTQGVYECGWTLPDLTTETELDFEKSAETVFRTLEAYDFDLALGTYMDCHVGVVPLGGNLTIPTEFGSILFPAKFPVGSQEAWSEVKKKLPLDPHDDPRIESMLKSIQIVSKAIGDTTPIAALWWPGTTVTLLMLRNIQDLLLDMAMEPEFAQEMFDFSNQFAMDFIRAQYQAGANSICIIGDVLGVEMISPAMCEEFVLPGVRAIADMVMEEFGQKTLLHIHGDFSKPDNYPLIEKFITEGHIGGIFLDEKHAGKWVIDNIRDKYHIPVCLPIHGPNLLEWSPEEIGAFVKDELEYAAAGGGVMMTPSCEIPPTVSQQNLKAWIDAVHSFE